MKPSYQCTKQSLSGGYFWRRSISLEEVYFLEEVLFVGGGHYFWRRSILLEEVYFFGGSFFVGGGHYFWRRSILLEDDPAERGCSRSRTTLGWTPTTPGGSHMTASLGRRYDPWPVKRSTDWLTDWFCWRRCIFWRKCFFCWRRSLGLFLEEVDFVGGGVFFWRKCFFCWRRWCVFLEQGGTNGPP